MHVEYTDETNEIIINRTINPFELVFIQISLEYKEI
jgi:hypothetical protein